MTSQWPIWNGSDDGVLRIRKDQERTDEATRTKGAVAEKENNIGRCGLDKLAKSTENPDMSRGELKKTVIADVEEAERIRNRNRR